MSHKKKILIIDDDARNIFALSMVLRSKGFECVSAPGAREGLNLLIVTPDIGIVLMDMMMPEMDGYQAMAEMRKMDRIADLPVIAVTAQAMTGDREKCLDAGASGYISKPVDIDQLLELLRAHMK
ncbi:response regulator [Hufsiella ginkgonis]|uniref:Response regulator n=1 Tax=Hufsiella ginkgonis TaxID=2695274 RepID=A0A7K1XSE4_9SPHI|nr:response regulator [Hufsiella ginkgonis]MXV13931.1 response regulator [Hufsiella ginkgonis]